MAETVFYQMIFYNEKKYNFRGLFVDLGPDPGDQKRPNSSGSEAATLVIIIV